MRNKRLASGSPMATKKFVNLVEGLLGLMFRLWVVFLRAPRVTANPHSGAEWNNTFVAMCGVALVSIGVLQNTAETAISASIRSSQSYAGL
jgi:hypothetical protein